MLELRPSCEHCDKPLPPDANDALICSFECTFCHSCVEQVLGDVCPNCGGNFTARPIRPAHDQRAGNCLINHPASKTRIHRAVDLDAHANFRQRLEIIAPTER